MPDRRVVAQALKVFLLLLLFVGCAHEPKEIADKRLPESTPELQTAEDRNPTIEAIVESERTILDLAPFVAKIGDSLTDSGKTSKERLRELFTQEVRYTPVSYTHLTLPTKA